MEKTFKMLNSVLIHPVIMLPRITLVPVGRSKVAAAAAAAAAKVSSESFATNGATELVELYIHCILYILKIAGISPELYDYDYDDY